MDSFVFYRLAVATTRVPWAGMGVSAIELTDSITNISQLRHAIYAANRRLVEAHVDELELRLYSRDVQLEAQTLLSECALQLKNVLTVAVVPDLFELLRRAHEATSSVEDPSAKRLKPHRTVIDDGVLQSARQNLNIESWKSTGVVPLQLHRIEPDFPKSFYIRQAIIDIIQVYRRQRDSDRQTMFVGSPGVGKSTLLMLFAFYRALYEKKRVVLFRRLGPNCYSMLHLDAVGKRCWRIDNAGLPDLDELRDHEFELFLDGFPSDFARFNYGRIEGFRFYVPSVLIEVNCYEKNVSRCVVPGWTKSELSSLGKYLGKSDDAIESQYFYSGGSVRDFLSDAEDVKGAMGAAVDELIREPQALLSLWHGLFLAKQLDRLRTAYIVIALHPVDQWTLPIANHVDKYVVPGWCTSVVTSAYALTLLREKAPVEFHEQLWDKGYMIGDIGLQAIAFENYMYAMAMYQKTITLEMRGLDAGHDYVSVDFETRPSPNAGGNATEDKKDVCNSVEYCWHPVDCGLQPIASILTKQKYLITHAKDVIAFLQPTTSASCEAKTVEFDTHPSWAVVTGSRLWYVVVVHDKQTCDSFRFDFPKSVQTEVEVYVAYVKDWAANRAPRATT